MQLQRKVELATRIRISILGRKTLSYNVFIEMNQILLAK